MAHEQHNPSPELLAFIGEHPEAPPLYSRVCSFEGTDHFRMWAELLIKAYRQAEAFDAADAVRAALTSDVFKVSYHRDGGVDVSVDQPKRRALLWTEWQREMTKKHRERHEAMGL